LSPETRRAELKILINDKVAACCWLFTSLYNYEYLLRCVLVSSWSPLVDTPTHTHTTESVTRSTLHRAKRHTTQSVPAFFSHYILYILWNGDRGGTVVEVLCYKSEGPWIDSRQCHWNFSLT
jgi:hypothetical protein